MRRIALVGVGKIALDQHVPALAASPDFTLAATVSRHGSVEGVEAFTDMDAFLAARPDVEVVSLCLPPQPRYAYAEAALRAGRHVMLEKPPGQTLAEVHALAALAEAQGVTLYATWHSRMAAAVDAAREWLAGRRVTGGLISWKEDVRHWHPGQEWVFEPGGMGVFDPGINALSILTAILPEPVHVTGAVLHVPDGRQTPIAAEIAFSRGVRAELDWLQTGAQQWDITVETEDGTLRLGEGGARLWIAGTERTPVAAAALAGEYPRLYARMAGLLARGQSDVDLAPMVLVSDALALGWRVPAAAFAF